VQLSTMRLILHYTRGHPILMLLLNSEYIRNAIAIVWYVFTASGNPELFKRSGVKWTVFW